MCWWAYAAVKIAHPPERISESRITRKSNAQDQRVQEEADQSLNLCPRTAGNGRADDNVVLAAVPGKQQLKCREESHEERYAFTLAKSLDSLHQVRQKLDALASAAMREHCWSWAVSGQLQQCRSAGELLFQ